MTILPYTRELTFVSIRVCVESQKWKITCSNKCGSDILFNVKQRIQIQSRVYYFCSYYLYNLFGFLFANVECCTWGIESPPILAADGTCNVTLVNMVRTVLEPMLRFDFGRRTTLNKESIASNQNATMFSVLSTTQYVTRTSR